MPALHLFSTPWLSVGLALTSPSRLECGLRHALLLVCIPAGKKMDRCNAARSQSHILFSASFFYIFDNTKILLWLFIQLWWPCSSSILLLVLCCVMLTLYPVCNWSLVVYGMVSIPFKWKIIIGLLMTTMELPFLAKSSLILVNDEGHQITQWYGFFLRNIYCVAINCHHNTGTIKSVT